METQINPQQVVIPKLGDVPAQSSAQAPGFAAFKAEEKLSFVRAYDPKVTSLADFRHAVIRYRNTEGKNTVTRPAQMVTIPVISFPSDYNLPKVAFSVFRGVLEDEQDNMLRSMIDTGVSNISWDSVSLENILASITAIRTSNRLTKEQIEAWAVKALQDVCYARADEISTAKGFDDAGKLKQRAGTLGAYVALIAKLSAPVPNIGMEGANAIKSIMAKANLADDIAKVLNKKVEAILNPPVLAGGDL